jgi:hypothetical protein
MGEYNAQIGRFNNIIDKYEYKPTQQMKYRSHQELFGMNIDLDEPIQVGILGDYLQNELGHEWYEIGVLLTRFYLGHKPNFAAIGATFEFEIELKHPYYMKFHVLSMGWRYSLQLRRHPREYDDYAVVFHQYYSQCDTNFVFLRDLVQRSYRECEDKKSILARINRNIKDVEDEK